MVWALVFSLLAALPFVLADGSADWQPVTIHYSWDLSMSGSCTNETQCLVDILGNSTHDADLMRWYELEESRNKPKCINNTQSLLDYYCDNGDWTTRTKLLALHMMKYAQTNDPSVFTLYCDSYQRVLNKYQYVAYLEMTAEEFLGESCSIAAGKTVPCINSICVLKTPHATLFGTTLNIPVNDPNKSFLRAIGKSPDLCKGTVAQYGNNFTICAGGDKVWYNPFLQSIIWVPLNGISSPTPDTAGKISNPMSSMSSYVMNVLQNPDNPGMNFIYFPRTRLFNHIYFAQNGEKSVFGFLEENMRPEYTLLPENESEPVPMDYIGVRYQNIEIGLDPCRDIIKVYDTKAFCENQTGAGFNVIARHRCEPGYEDYCKGASPIVGAWPALTGKIRP